MFDIIVNLQQGRLNFFDCRYLGTTVYEGPQEGQSEPPKYYPLWICWESFIGNGNSYINEVSSNQKTIVYYFAIFLHITDLSLVRFQLVPCFFDHFLTNFAHVVIIFRIRIWIPIFSNAMFGCRTLRRLSYSLAPVGWTPSAFLGTQKFFTINECQKNNGQSR